MEGSAGQATKKEAKRTMKNNLFKKASALFLAVALATTGMPLGLVGAGEVQAADEEKYFSPSGINLDAKNVETTATVKDVTYGGTVGTSNISLVIKKDSVVVAKGTLAEFIEYGHIDADKSDISYQLSKLTSKIGKNEGTLNIVGSSTQLQGSTTVSFSYEVSKPTDAKILIFSQPCEVRRVITTTSIISCYSFRRGYC